MAEITSLNESDEFINKLNDEIAINKMAKALMDRHPMIQTLGEAEEIAEELSQKEFTYIDVQNGITDYEVSDIIRRQRMIRNTLLGKEKGLILLKDTDLKKRSFSKETILKIIATSLGVASAFVIAGYAKKGVDKLVDNYKEYHNEKSVSESIGKLAGDDKLNIINQNIKILGLDDNGQPIYDYDRENIAQDIIRVCENKPELLEICLYDTYFNMELSRLYNMDSIFTMLKAKISDGSSLAFLKKYDSFLDYILALEIIDKNDAKYGEVVKAIKDYDEIRDFDSLDAGAKSSILYLISECENRKKILNNEWVQELNNFANESLSGGGR